MGIAAAIIGGAALTGVAALGGSMIQSNAAQKASSQQAATANKALGIQQQQFATGQAAVQPFITAGSSVLPTLTSLQNPGTAASTLQNLPGFQFASQWGTKATQNALAAQGLGGSTGPLASGISQFNNGLASQNYAQYINQLQTTAGLGSASASSLLSGANQAGAIQGGTLQNLGNAQAAGTLGSASAISNGLNSAAGGIGNSLLLSSLLGGGGGSTGTSVYGSGAAPYGQNPAWFTGSS